MADITSALFEAPAARTMICKQCGCECERTGQRQFFCAECKSSRKNAQSRVNAARYNRAKGKAVAGDSICCKICGVLFVARQGGNKYCSAKCRRSNELTSHHDKTRTFGLAKVGDVFQCQDCGLDTVRLSGSQKRCETCKKSADLERSARWISDNPEKVKEKQRLHDAKRKDDPKRREKSKVYAKRRGKKRTADPGKNLHHRMSQLIRVGLIGGKAGRTWLAMVPYTVEQLSTHLERQFSPGMSWGNMGEWHIDHIIPRSAFNFSSPEDEDFKACWALANLRPLPAVENIKKSNKRLLLL